VSELPVAFAADHAGYDLKQYLLGVLRDQGRPVLDLGTDGTASVDYPDFAGRLARCLQEGKAERGVLVCGTGLGISMAANRHPWVRAAPCQDSTAARLARAHNDANVLGLGARLVGEEVARDALMTFLATPFEGGRHARRVEQMSQPGPA
jgi:ribose 5-phosphate isomerase B